MNSDDDMEVSAADLWKEDIRRSVLPQLAFRSRTHMLTSDSCSTKIAKQEDAEAEAEEKRRELEKKRRKLEREKSGRK